MWQYKQTTGELRDAQGNVVAKGYSGKREYKNKHEHQDVVGMGPIPVGCYTINPPHQSLKTGPYAMDLQPDSANNMFGRSAFQMHGDSLRNPGTASSGCIIMPRAVRERVWSSLDHRIEVIA